jgi:hypothetical protein
MSREERLRIGAALPGALLPVVAGAIAATAGALIGMPMPWIAVFGAVALVGGAVRMIGGAWIAAGALMLALASVDPSPGRTATVIAAVHLLQVLGSLMLVVPLRSRVALRALAPTAVRFLVVQVLCQAVGLLASLLPARSGLPAAVIVGSVAVLLFAVVATRMLRARRAAGFSKAERALGASVGDPS